MKKLGIFFIILALVLAGGFFYLKSRKSADFEPLIKSKLQALVKNGTDGLYYLDMDKIEIDIIASTIIVMNARLSPDSVKLAAMESLKTAPDNIFKVQLAALEITGISPADLLDKTNLDLEIVYLKEPKLQVYHQKRNYNFKDTSNFYRRISKDISQFELKKLVVEKIDFTFINVTKKNQMKLKNLSASFTDIKIDSITQADTSRFLYAKDADILVKDYKVSTPDKMYNVTVDSLAVHASTRRMDLHGFAMKPTTDKKTFSKQMDYAKDRFDLTISKINLLNIQWWSLLAEEGLFADEMNINNGNLKVYNDKGLPLGPESKVGTYPHQLLQKLELPVMIKKINIKSTDIAYQQLNPKSAIEGSLQFKNTNGVITNVTNIKENIAGNGFAVVDATTKLMGTGNLRAVFKLDLKNEAKEGNFSVDADLGPMNGTVLNDAFTAMGLVKILSLKINSLKAHVDGNNNLGTGTVRFAYQDLKVDVLKKDSDDNNKLKKRKFISMIANTFVIKDQNPKEGKELETVNASYTRDIHKSIFNVIWKTLQDGMGKAATGKTK